MTTLSVPIPQDLVDFVDEMVEMGKAETKAEVFRMGLRKIREDNLIENLLKAKQEYREGKTLTGDLRKIIESIPD